VVALDQTGFAGDSRTSKLPHKPFGIPCEGKETLAQRKAAHASPNASPTAVEFLIIARSNGIVLAPVQSAAR
jgi:hypothetical protein